MKKLAGTISVILVCASIYGQSDSSGVSNSNEAVVLAAGTQYKASGWKTLWWGKHYREEWNTPVAFSILKISSFDGGLKPVKAGGGHQSKTLRLISNNGKEYVLRTIDKNLDVLIPEHLKGTFINDIVNDQISTAHPYGAIAIAHMAGSLSLLHTNPKIYYVPDDPALDEFRTTFANKLCLLEERPSGKGWDHTELFRNADDIINTEKMLGEVYQSSKNAVDQQSLLKVRFFDLVVNDWDRHEDQWIWAMKKEDNKRVYIPIARDRDQAFSKTDGISMYLLSRRWALRPLQNMHSRNRDVRGANFSARNLDQQFLNRLTKEQWKKGVESIQTELTDAAIEEAIATMPAEVNKISGDFLIRRLKQRRDNLMRDGMRFYSIVSKQITINGSAENEKFIVNHDNEDEVAVTGLRLQNDTFYHRVFNRNETKEINIYGLGGNDQYSVEGNAKNRFTVRMIGGPGENNYSSAVSSGGKSHKVYDSLIQKDISRDVFKANKKWDTLYRYNRSSVKYDYYLPLVLPGFNQDDGFSISLGLLYKKQIWGKTPFGWQQSLTVDYATGTQALGFNYRGLFKQTFGQWDFDLAAYYKGPRYTFNYYGLGNETELNGNDRSYFRVKGNDLYFGPGISRTWKFTNLRFGLQYENVLISRAQDKFVTSPQSGLSPSVFSSINFGGVNGQWTFSKAGEQRIRTKGVHLTGGFSFLNNLDNSTNRMLRLNSSVSLYHTFFKRLTFAHRTGGATTFGDVEFYQANTLGGSQNLRGYWRDRFTGKSSFYQNTDLRLVLFDIKGYVVTGKFGVFTFFDDGRVWVKNESSSTLHTGYGGGIFLAPYQLAVLSFYYAESKEAKIFTLKAGVFF